MRWVVGLTHHGRITVSSDLARAWAPELAATASEGLITTWQHEVGYGRVWRPTAAGLLFLETGDL